MSAICVIPARGGSRRIPGKNKKLFHGKPIILYSIEAAQQSGLFSRIIVSTDDLDIVEIATRAGCEIHYRDEETARDEVGTQEVMKRVLLDMVKIEDRGGVACCIYPTAPLISDSDLMCGKYAIEDGKRYAFSVGTDPLCDAGQFYWGRFVAFISGQSLIGPNTEMIPVSKTRVCDINTPEDWDRALRMYEELHKND